MRFLLILSSLVCLLVTQAAMASRQLHLPDTIKEANGHYSVGKFKDGLKHGIWRSYNHQGHLIEQTKYKAGVIIRRKRYIDGRLSEIINRHGTVTRTRSCGC